MADFLCSMPFIQFSTTVEGLYQACCIAKAEGNMTFENTSPMEFFNSDHMKQIRYDMATGNKSELLRHTCAACINQEKFYGVSKRIDSLSHYIHGELLTDELVESVRNNPNIDLKPSDIDHVKMKVFGNICNLRCTMCHPVCSSKLAAEFKRYGKWNGPTLLNSYDKIDKDKLYADLEIICPVLREFEIVGGEPLMMDQAIEMVEWIVEKGYAENMEFRIITNATIDNFDFYRLMKHFKKATFLVSLDAVGKKEEYIRTGTIWEEKVEVLRNTLRAGIKIGWSSTIQMLNIGYLNDIHNFALSLMEEFPMKRNMVETPYLNNLLSRPAALNAMNLPKDIREQYINKYKSLDYDFHHKDRFIKNLEEANPNPDYIYKAMSHYKFFDEKRGTCLLDEYPEFENYYSAVGPKILY